MPPKRSPGSALPSSSSYPALSASTSSSAADYFGTFYRELTAPENQSVVRSVVIFGVRLNPRDWNGERTGMDN